MLKSLHKLDSILVYSRTTEISSGVQYNLEVLQTESIDSDQRSRNVGSEHSSANTVEITLCRTQSFDYQKVSHYSQFSNLHGYAQETSHMV